jgi:Icc-related predicted phosphoesterase
MTIRGTEKELTEAADHIAGYPCRVLIVVPGNHDILFQTEPEKALEIFTDRNIKVLIDRATEVVGVKIFGSPWVKKCWGVFGYEHSIGDNPFLKIPEDTEILITHSPPRYTLDRAPDGTHLGSEWLSERINTVKPKYHVFGHIHCAYGIEKVGDTVHINAATCSERYDVLNPPVIFHYGLPGQYERW